MNGKKRSYMHWNDRCLANHEWLLSPPEQGVLGLPATPCLLLLTRETRRKRVMMIEHIARDVSAVWTAIWSFWHSVLSWLVT